MPNQFISSHHTKLDASLVIVGSGIKFLSHLTTEAKAYIEQSDVVLYLVNDPAMKEWIQKNNKNAKSLDVLYTEHPLRIDCYHGITRHILNTLNQYQHVCVVLYGHPTVFSKPALDAALQAKQDGYYVKVLPGISAEDCLFADLLIDPGSCGCQSFEATDFLIHHRKYDPTSHLILWQVGTIGILNHSEAILNDKGIKFLMNYLIYYYSENHEVILYEAAQYPSFEPYVKKIALKELSVTPTSSLTTLYIPPAHQALCDLELLKVLAIDIHDLSL